MVRYLMDNSGLTTQLEEANGQLVIVCDLGGVVVVEVKRICPS